MPTSFPEKRKTKKSAKSWQTHVKTTGTTSRKEQAATNSSSRVQTNLSPQAIQKRPVKSLGVFI
jgi:hypothetical protein